MDIRLPVVEANLIKSLQCFRDEDSENKEGEVFEVENTNMCLAEDVEKAVEEEVGEVVDETVEIAVEDVELDVQPKPQNKSGENQGSFTGKAPNEQFDLLHNGTR
ncbi:hypothetical protein FQA39_LY10562 [Lamprigera yunnana]|nr:hypothetical protein FQA39_LY10562 [Lamprigera yunnana]